MIPTETAAILRRLADDWRHEEAKLCKQFGDVVIPQSMRARRIKDTEAIDAAIEMLDRLEAAEKERDALSAKIAEMEKQEPVAKVESWTNGSYTRHYKLKWLRDVGEGAALYTLPGAQTQGEEK